MKGLRARGGFEVDMEWKHGRLKAAQIHATVDGLCKVRYRTGTLELEFARWQQPAVDGARLQIISVITIKVFSNMTG